MNTVIYARYSSDNQREESIEGQLRECKAFAERNGMTIVGEYIDRAKSATTANRPEFQRMIADSKRNGFEVVLVWKLDRFARNRYDSANYKAQLRKNGVKVVSATESISEGAEGVTLKQMEIILKNKGVVNQKGKMIGHTTLANILRSRKYIGEYKFNDIVIPNGIPAIISEELFNKVQRMLDVNATHGGKYYSTEDYILSTKLFCGKCGAMMTGESGTARSGVVYRYYKCNNSRKHLCDKKTIKKDYIENIVLNEISAMLSNDENIERMVVAVMKAQSKESSYLSHLQNELAEIDKGIDNLLNAIQMGIVTSSTKKGLKSSKQNATN